MYGLFLLVFEHRCCSCFCQVFAVSEELVSQVLSRLTDMLVDEFCKLIAGVKTFTSHGAVTVSPLTCILANKQCSQPSNCCHTTGVSYT